MKLLFACGLFAASAFAQTAPPVSMPGLKLSLDELRAQYTHVGIGRRLKPKVWPNGARVAVALSFDVDNATVPLNHGDLGSEVISRGHYGAVDGLPRILRLLDDQNVPASFFIPAVSAALDPDIVPSILSHRRHEIGVHGWIHEDLGALNNQAEEQRLLDAEILSETCRHLVGKTNGLLILVIGKVGGCMATFARLKNE